MSIAAQPACVSAILPPRVTPDEFVEHEVTTENLVSYKGFALGPLRISHYRRSERQDSDRAVRMVIDDRETNDQYRASCLQRYEPQGVVLVCLLQGPTAEPALLWLTGQGDSPLKGELRSNGAPMLKLDGQIGGQARVTRTPTLVMTAASTTPPSLAGAFVQLGAWSRVQVDPEIDPIVGRWVYVVGLIQSAIEDPRDRDLDFDAGAEGATLDAYDLRPRTMSEPAIPTLLAAAEQWPPDHDAHANVGAVLDKTLRLERGYVFDEAAGAAVERSSVRGPVMEIAAGPASGPGPDGRADIDADGLQFHVAGGVRWEERTTLLMRMGLQVGAADQEAFTRALDPSSNTTFSSTSAAFRLGILVRHALPPLVSSLEPVIGMAVGPRLLLLDRTAVESGGSSQAEATLFGVGFEPSFGLQFAPELGAYRSRVVFFGEVAPELLYLPAVSTSQSGDTSASISSEAQLRRLGDQPNLQLGSRFGIRLEL